MADSRSTIGPHPTDREADRGFAARPGAPALWIGAAVAAAVATLLVLLGVRAFGPRAFEPQLRRFAIPVPRLDVGANHPARISPDGRYLLYSSGNRLMVRDLERFDPAPVAGADGAFGYFWSHDSRRIGFCRSARIWASDRTGANTNLLCDLPAGGGIHGADWGPDGSVVFARDLGGLYVVPASGGTPRLLLRPRAAEVDFHGPQFLPDGRHVLALAHRESGVNAVIVVSVPEGIRKDLGELEGLRAARHSPSGHLFLTLHPGVGEVRAVPFAGSALEITGDPVLTLAGATFPSFSRDGTLVYNAESSPDSTGSAAVDCDLRAVGGPTGAILLVENWTQELRARPKE